MYQLYFVDWQTVSLMEKTDREKTDIYNK